ncbi:MAG TPA: efflux RND transporter periplasmic adaptor subunit [Vicinamibacterales bacterium]
MKRALIVVVVLAVAGAGVWYFKRGGEDANAASNTPATNQGRGGRQGGGGPGGGGFGGPGGPFGFPGGGGPRQPMTVEVAMVKRADMTESLTVVGNLIGAATVEAVPKVSGRLDDVTVRLGDRVRKGQTLAKVEDREIAEQVKQAQASFDVAAATIRQREADLRLAQTNLERSKNLFERSLIPKQTFDDTDARYQAAAAQLDLAKAQYQQAQARLDELKINLANTIIASPVSGFVGKRALDPGAWVTPNSSFISVVDIAVVRLVANVVERDLGRINAGMKADVVVDAYPGEHFTGSIAHVAPVLDPATRTAQIEVEIDNNSFRLKPGMYAKVSFVIAHKPNVLVVPANAVIDAQGKKGVYVPGEGDVAKFQAVTLGMADPDKIEITAGVNEGMSVISTGAAALREGDRIVLLGQGGGRGGNGGRGGRGGGRGTGRDGQGGGQRGNQS